MISSHGNTATKTPPVQIYLSILQTSPPPLSAGVCFVSILWRPICAYRRMHLLGAVKRFPCGLISQLCDFHHCAFTGRKKLCASYNNFNADISDIWTTCVTVDLQSLRVQLTVGHIYLSKWRIQDFWPTELHCKRQMALVSEHVWRFSIRTLVYFFLFTQVLVSLRFFTCWYMSGLQYLKRISLSIILGGYVSKSASGAAVFVVGVLLHVCFYSNVLVFRIDDKYFSRNVPVIFGVFFAVSSWWIKVKTFLQLCIVLC